MSLVGSEMNSSDFNVLNPMSDNELVKVYRDERDSKLGKNAVSVLISRYLRLVRKRACFFSSEYADAEDLTQEGFLAFINAVNSFDTEHGAKFSSFADVCVTNGIKSAVIKMKKNFGEACSEVIEDNAEDLSTPESICVERDKIEGIYNEIASLLSEKEWSIFRLYLAGLSYKEISEILSIPLKTVDNAVFRVRKKLKTLFSQDKLIN